MRPQQTPLGRRRRLRIVVWVGVGLALGVGLVGFGLVGASRHVPEFYLQALHADPANYQAAARQMHLRCAELASRAQRIQQWQQVFSAEEINGWLAVGASECPADPADSWATLIPDFLREPRVAITPEAIFLACRYDRGLIGSAVLWVQAEPSVTEQGELAIRLRKVRAGRLPVPPGMLLEHLGRSLRRLPWRTRLSEVEGDPVLLLAIPPVGPHAELSVRIDAIRLDRGQIHVAGTTQRRR